MELIWFVFYIIVSRVVFGDFSLSLNGLSIEYCKCEANTSGYIPKNVLPTKIEIDLDTVFLAYPRYRKAVPVTLGSIELHSKSKVAVKPFPSQDFQRIGDCNVLQSVEDLFIDTHKILWVLDTGVIESMEAACCVCPPKVMGFCPMSGRLMEVVDLSLLESSARPKSIAVERDIDGSCFLYISDTDRASLWILRLNTAGENLVSHSHGEGRSTVAKRILLPVASPCESLHMAPLHNMLLLHCAGLGDMFSVDTARARSGDLATAVVRLASTAPAAEIVFLGTDRLYKLFYRYVDDNEVVSWDVRTALARTRAPGRSKRSRLTVQAVVASGSGGGGSGGGGDRAVALAADADGFASGRVSCAGAEARLFTITVL